MALYNLVLEYSVYGEVCQNRFHYASASSGPLAAGANQLVRAFQADVLVAIADLMTGDGGDVVLDKISAVNLYDDTDFTEDTVLVPPVPPVGHGQALSTFVALSFTSPRFRSGRNRASKRFAGIGETDVTGNTFTNSTTANAVADAISAPVIDSASLNEFSPVLLFLDPLSTPPYKLYSTEALQRAEMAEIILIAYRNLTTQRSRKEGVGI